MARVLSPSASSLRPLLYRNRRGCPLPPDHVYLFSNTALLCDVTAHNVSHRIALSLPVSTLKVTRVRHVVPLAIGSLRITFALTVRTALQSVLQHICAPSTIIHQTRFYVMILSVLHPRPTPTIDPLDLLPLTSKANVRNAPLFAPRRTARCQQMRCCRRQAPASIVSLNRCASPLVRDGS